MWRRLRLGSFGLRILASFGALGAQMKQTYEGPGEGCRSSVQHCDSFRGRMLHPGQAQPETWSFGSLLERVLIKIKLLFGQCNSACRLGLHN